MLLKYKEGVDLSGNDIIKTKKFLNVKPEAQAQGLFDAVAVLGTLIRYPLIETVRSDDSVLINA